MEGQGQCAETARDGAIVRVGGREGGSGWLVDGNWSCSCGGGGGGGVVGVVSSRSGEW